MYGTQNHQYFEIKESLVCKQINLKPRKHNHSERLIPSKYSQVYFCHILTINVGILGCDKIFLNSKTAQSTAISSLYFSTALPSK